MKIVTSLSFRRQCREAFEFYAKVLGGKITAAFPYGDGPPDMPVDPKVEEQGSESTFSGVYGRRANPP